MNLNKKLLIVSLLFLVVKSFLEEASYRQPLLLLLLLSYIYIAPILKNKAISAVHKQKILLLIKGYSKIG